MTTENTQYPAQNAPGNQTNYQGNQGQTQAGYVEGATTNDWTTQMSYQQGERPKIGRQPNQFRELLKNTLRGGSVVLPVSALPIKLKSLRTQVVAIAKNFRAISHVVERQGTVHMWLEPRPAGAMKSTPAKGTAQKTGQKRARRNPRKATASQG